MTDLKEPVEEAPATPAIHHDAESEGLAIEAKSFGRQTFERFIRHRGAVVSLVILVVLIVGFYLGPNFVDYSYDERNIRDARQGISSEHPFGTDPIGRDLLARVLQGGQISIQIGLIVAIVSSLIGTFLGALAGYFGKWVDMLISQLINLFLVVPAFVVLLVLAVKYGGGVRTTALIVAILSWVPIARLVRGQVLQLKEQEFVQAARAAGAGPTRIILRHLLPNVLGVILVQTTLIVGGAIVLESTLSFLGLGVQAPATSLGVLVNEGRGYLETRPSGTLIPGGFIVLIVLCINFLGDGMRDAFDPTSRKVRE